MAKTQKYDDELLLEAVLKYSNQYKGIIKATKLAMWCQDNIPGLKGVEYYHFMRPTQELNPKNGKLEKKKKKCLRRVCMLQFLSTVNL